MTDESRLLAVFQRVFRRSFNTPDFAVKDVPEWDSLSHIKLIMSLESEFGIAISPDEIPGLYSNFANVQDFVTQKNGNGRHA